MGLSPWIDARFHGTDRADASRRVDAQTHRRFVKSHLAADGLRFFPEAKYIVVGRDTRDVFMSLWNHYSAYTDLAYSLFNDADRPGPEFPRAPGDATRAVAALDRRGLVRLGARRLAVLVAPPSPRHLVGVRATCRTCMFVHYGDLLADTESEMRRIAAFCDIDVAEDRWPAIVEVVGLDAMRAEATGADDDDDPAAMIFEGGVEPLPLQGHERTLARRAHRRRSRPVRPGRGDARSGPPRVARGRPLHLVTVRDAPESRGPSGRGCRAG